MRRHFLAWGIVVLGAIIALVVFLVAFTTPFFGHTGLEQLQEHMWQTTGAFAGLALFIIALVLQIIVTLESRSIEVTRLLQRIERTKSHPTLEPMGTAAGIVSTEFRELSVAAQSASFVKNTLIFSNLTSDDIEAYLSESNVAYRFSVLKKTLSNGGIWNDLISDNTQNAVKCKHFVKAIQDTKQNWKNTYRPVLIKAEPAVNMVLFDKREVWFGFGLFSQDASPVYRTSNLEVINYFDRYWDALAKSAAPWNVLWRNDIEGVWLSIGWDTTGALNDCGVVTIELVDTELKVHGYVIGCTGKKWDTKVRSFESNSSFFSIPPGSHTASFDFIFTRKNGPQVIKGGASYSFAFDPESTVVPTSFEGIAFTAEGRTREVFGRRINSTWAGRAAAGPGGLHDFVNAMTADNIFAFHHVSASTPFSANAASLNTYLF